MGNERNGKGKESGQYLNGLCHQSMKSTQELCFFFTYTAFFHHTHAWIHARICPPHSARAGKFTPSHTFPRFASSSGSSCLVSRADRPPSG